MEKLTLSDLQKEELRATFNKFKPNENDKINI